MAVAWRYYTLDGLAAVARRYLAGRSIDVSALEAREGRPLAGHTPKSHSGLVDHLRRNGFTADEAVDAGLAGRHPNGEVADFFVHRMVLAVRGERDRVVGLIGRDVSGGLRAKYLNSPTTAVYDKGRHLYRPRRAVMFPSNIVVVEGAIDALAIEAVAAHAGYGITAVSPSGTAFTAEHRAQVAAWATSPPVLCADGDAAGRAATLRWAIEMTTEGQEVFTLTLPQAVDPADWVTAHGAEGLRAFVISGSRGSQLSEPGAVHAGRYLAAELAQRQPLSNSIAVLASAGSQFPTGPTRGRFLREAARGLAEAGLGPDGWLGRRLAAAVTSGSPGWTSQLDGQHCRGDITV